MPTPQRWWPFTLTHTRQVLECSIQTPTPTPFPLFTLAVGSGFSYSNTPSDYNTNNNKTADDAYTFLQLWTEAFPAFATNDLWISGESYAGTCQQCTVLTARLTPGVSV